MFFRCILPLLFLVWIALGNPVRNSADNNGDELENHVQRGLDLENRYVVVLKDDTEVDRLINSLDQLISTGISFKYTRALKGFAGKFGALEVAALRALPAVKYVEKDKEVSAHIKETNATYGLAITSEKERLSPENQSTYYYKPTNGTTTVYVIDTGIDITHPEFGGRASFARDFTGEGMFDGEGHGTHVAGTIGSKTYGVFKTANLVAVKVLSSSGSGQISGIIAGIDWVSGNHEGVSVINMSLGTSVVSQAVNDAARGAHDAGIVVVVSAGNNGDYGMGACMQSPASEPSAITVGAINKAYKAVGFSSEDKCVDIHAPGLNVLSTWPGGGTERLSGTSMSSPHVAGVAAYFISQFGLTGPDIVLKTILKNAERGLLTNLRGAPNILANNGFFK